jgi:cytochrome c-type biogenesis protein CcmF
MIAELGHLVLCLALGAALIQGTLPLWGAQRGDARLMVLGPAAAHVQLLLVLISFGALTWLFWVSDFSVKLVFDNSHTLKPDLYKITGVWANHEGSLLLWVLILAAAGASVAAFGRNLPADFLARVLAVQGWIAIGFYLFMLLTSNPFARQLPVAPEGNGLNPLLQDPGLAFHPPMLYVGYVGLSVAFSFAIAALIEGRIGPVWAKWVRPWTLFAWAFLTLGIALGSWWAYYELGWGGWWFWDPVENASLMPWIAATALFHSAVVLEKRDALKSWTVLLAIIAFSLSLMGTFIVRSGVLTSVHAFAVDPERGVFILGFLLVVVGGALALYAWRASSLEAGGAFTSVSREGALVANNLLLSASLATVFIGTLYPLALDALTGKQISVGPPYFNATFTPLMIPLIAVMGVGPFLAWRKDKLSRSSQPLMIAGIITLVLMAAVLVGGTRAAFALVGFAAAFWLAASVLVDLGQRLRWGEGGVMLTLGRLRRLPASAWSLLIAHLGVAVTAFGVTASGAWRIDTLTVVQVGESVAVGDFQFQLKDVQPVAGPNYTAMEGTVRITRDGQEIAILNPDVRTYTDPPMETTEAGIKPLWSGDLYAVIGEPQPGNRWQVRFHYKPFVAWIWYGALLMALGGFIGIADRRLRIGAAARAPLPPVDAPSRGPAPVAQPAE